MKTCSRCERTLDESCFVKSARYIDGLTQPCKECRKEKQRLRLESNPFCIMCKTEPHMKGNYYCRTCLRIINNLPIERERPNVDRNNKTMRCGCKIRPRAKGGHYCVECKREMHSEWTRTSGKDYLNRGDNREKHNARQYIGRLVRSGKLQRGPCEVCGNPEVQAHHYRGYDRENRKYVKWLCITHHREAHKLQVDS